MVNVLVVQDREQPSPQIGTLLPQMQFAEGARQAILNEIVGGDDIAGQCARIAAKARNLGFDLW